MTRLDLLDWRREVAGIYRDVRANPDPAEAHREWSHRRQHLFATHPESPDHDARLQHAPYDASLRFDVVVDVDVAPTGLEIPTATDGVVPMELVGRVNLDGVGSLDLWWVAVYGGGIWLPLRDSDPATYGGGRYVLDTVKGADLGGQGGHLVVDLNFAYNPSCAYDERWACPLAPPGNVVSGAVHAGELLSKG